MILNELSTVTTVRDWLRQMMQFYMREGPGKMQREEFALQRIRSLCPIHQRMRSPLEGDFQRTPDLGTPA